jgi:rsbT antagonist protein RsbS
MNDSTLDDSFAAGASATSMQMTRGSLVVALQREFDEQWLLRLRRDLLDRIQRSGVRRVVLDATAVETMDSVDFRMLRQTLDMVGLMGAVAVVVGLGPGVVSALVTMDVDVSGLRGAPNLDRGLQMLEHMALPRNRKAGLSGGRHTPGGTDSHRR